MKVGETYSNPRGRTYRVLRFEPNGLNDVVLLNVWGTEDRAISAMMVPENGWRLVSETTKDGVSS